MKNYKKFLFGGFLSCILAAVPIALATSCSSSTDYVDETDYNVTWQGPKDSDYKLNRDDPKFTSDYIAKNWFDIDEAYTKEYKTPKVIVTESKADASALDIEVKFDAVVTINSGGEANEVTSYSKTVSGFNTPTPPTPDVKKFFKWHNDKGHDYKIELNTFKNKALSEQVKAILDIDNPGDNMTPDDISSINYKDMSNSSGSNGEITVKITVNFKEDVYLNDTKGTPQKSWSTTGMFIKDYVSIPTKFTYLQMVNTDQLPSSITKDYAKNNLFSIVDQKGVAMDSSSYVQDIKLYPNDAGGYLVMSVVFNSNYTFARVGPSNDPNNSNYTTPEHFWNATFTNMKTNKKPFYNISGYMPDWAQYEGHKFFNMKSMGNKINNYNDYIFSFLNPDVNGDIQFGDGWGDFTTDMSLNNSSTQYKKQKLAWPFDLWPDGDNFLYHYPDPKHLNPIDHTIDNGGLVGQLMEVKSLYGVRTSASIGGWSYSSNFALIFSKPDLRQHMIDRIVELIQRWGFDNIDLDFEYPGVRRSDSFVHYPAGTPDPSEDKENLLTFVRELRTQLDNNPDPDVANTTISMAISTNPETIKAGIDPALKNYINQFNIMTYDMHGSFDDLFGNAAQLYSDKELIQAILANESEVTIDNKLYHIDQSYFDSYDKAQLENEFMGDFDFSVDGAVNALGSIGVPTRKMNIGMAQYTRGFYTDPSKGSPITEIPGLFTKKIGTETGNWETAGGTAGSSSFASLYSEAKNNRNGWKLETDPISKSQFYYNVGGTEQWNGQSVNGLVMTVDTPQSVSDKLAYVKSEGLGGVISWDVSGEWDGSNNYNVLSDEYKQELSSNLSVSIDNNYVNQVVALKRI